MAAIATFKPSVTMLEQHTVTVMLWGPLICLPWCRHLLSGMIQQRD